MKIRKLWRSSIGILLSTFLLILPLSVSVSGFQQADKSSTFLQAIEMFPIIQQNDREYVFHSFKNQSISYENNVIYSDLTNQESQESAQTAEITKLIAQSLISGNNFLDVSGYFITESDLINILERIIPTQYPEAMEVERYNYGINTITKQVVYVIFEYPYDQQAMQARNIQVEQAANAILARIDPTMTDLQKVKAIHDYLVSTVSYDYEIIQLGFMRRSSFSVYGALVDQRAVCQGYALAFQMLMNRLGIPSLFVSSEAMNHAWNMVRIGDDWYHVDSTWDDPVPDIPERVQYQTFMVSSTKISSSENAHYGWNMDLPEASNEQYDNFDWTSFSSPMHNSSILTLDTKTYQGEVGKSYQFAAAELPEETLTVTSSDPSVASVSVINLSNPNRRIYQIDFMKEGEATILVSSKAGGLQKITISAFVAQKAAA